MTPDRTQQPSTRPSWLPIGHSICPGARETVRQRLYIADALTHDPNDPNQTPFMQMIYTCEHGEWTNQAEAWWDHESVMPELQPNSDQSVTLHGTVIYDAPASNSTTPLPELDS